jgi:hypothetical protein
MFLKLILVWSVCLLWHKYMQYSNRKSIFPICIHPSEGEEKTKVILSNNIYGCSCVQKIQVFEELLLQCSGIEMCALRNAILCGENQSENQSRFVKNCVWKSDRKQGIYRTFWIVFWKRKWAIRISEINCHTLKQLFISLCLEISLKTWNLTKLLPLCMEIRYFPWIESYERYFSPFLFL